MNRSVGLALAAMASLAPAPAAAHETLHEVRRGRAVALRAFFADGEALAYAACEVYSPADPRIPHQKGRTDRSGWVAFVPDAPGKWRIKVVDGTGHGLDVEIDAEAPEGSAAAPISSTDFLLRPLVGLSVIGAIFTALFFFHRKGGRTP